MNTVRNQEKIENEEMHNLSCNLEVILTLLRSSWICNQEKKSGERRTNLLQDSEGSVTWHYSCKMDQGIPTTVTLFFIT